MARDVRRPLAAEPGLPGSTFEWVEALRGAAIERFRKNGFPTPKVEAWKFTKLGPLERIAFRSDTGQAGPIVTKAALAPYRLTPECHLAVFVNGRFRPDLSALDHLPTGTAVVGLASAGEDDLRALLAPPAVATEARARALFDLNTAMAGAPSWIRFNCCSWPCPMGNRRSFTHAA
jgi:Fe-S cluster assembly protein SufD